MTPSMSVAPVTLLIAGNGLESQRWAARDGGRREMSDKKSADGAGFVAGFFIFVIALIMQIPKEVWIGIGIAVALVVVVAISYRIVNTIEQRGIAKATAAKREREEQARRKRQRRIDALGKQNAQRVESALSAARRVTASEAARAGWLGDVDFSVDIKAITDNFKKAHALREVTGKLAALDKPSAEDRKILAEARATIANLERAAIERVELIGKCATEAQLIDKSLCTEREDARVAEQRAELHAKLSAMLYGIEATPDTGQTDSAVEAVMARVQAYREIKNQIQQARDSGSG
jgi:hypothetical protein